MRYLMIFLTLVCCFSKGYGQGFKEVKVGELISSYEMIDSNLFACASDTVVSSQPVISCCCEKTITAEGLKIIQTGYSMSVNPKSAIRGTCWNYLDRVYTKAGFPGDKRTTVFKSKQKGPYADVAQLQPGDWVYHVNYSYYNVGHSAIFLCWKDFDKKIAITLSHYGESRICAGVYGEFDLSGVYYIMRPKSSLSPN